MISLQVYAISRVVNLNGSSALNFHPHVTTKIKHEKSSGGSKVEKLFASERSGWNYQSVFISVGSIWRE